MKPLNKTWTMLALVVSVVLLLSLELTEGRKVSGSRDNDDDNDNSKRQIIDSERSKLFQSLQRDPETSAQALNPAIQNPLLYQQGLGGYGGLGGSGLANLGGGVFSNQQFNPYAQAQGFQNPLLQQQLQLAQLSQFGLGGVAPDIYTQGALAAQLYNNPLYGAGAGSLTGAAAGINPLLLRGAQNQQYPVIGGLGAYNNPYLNAQALLSPYSNYNQLYNYPFSSRFGIGAGTGRSGLQGRFNSQSNNGNDNE